MKKVTIILSFVLISVFSTGSYLLHLFYLENYKTEFKAYISQTKQHASFTTIQINPSELYTNSSRITWEDENKEVVYKGVLYDVVSVKGKGLSVELTMVSDHQEMALKEDFAKTYDVNMGQTRKEPIKLLKNFLALKYLFNNTSFELNNTNITTVYFNTLSAFQITAVVINPDIPPPDNFI